MPKQGKTLTQLLASELEQSCRLRLLRERHILPLTSLVEEMRAALGERYYVPWFDPMDGGTSARVLFLLESPGPKTKRTGFISIDNPDMSAWNSRDLCARAGLSRELCVRWNIVPWYLESLDQSKSFRAPRGKELSLAAQWTMRLLNLLPQLQWVVLMGRNAQNGCKQSELGSALAARKLRTKELPHPSGLSKWTLADDCWLRELSELTEG